MFDTIRDTGSFQGAINTFSKKVEEADQVRNIKKKDLRKMIDAAKSEAKDQLKSESIIRNNSLDLTQMPELKNY